jgi:hypothetical protein
MGAEFVFGAHFSLEETESMGIDIFLEWRDKEKEQTPDDAPELWSQTQGHVGYLRESYKGEPYATKFLVREAFEAENYRAKIPAAVLRKRLTTKTKPFGRLLAEAVAKAIEKQIAKTGKLAPAPSSAILQVEWDELNAKPPVPAMTVEEAVCLRYACIGEYGDEKLEDILQSFRDFVDLAERKEKEMGEPCIVYADF